MMLAESEFFQLEEEQDTIYLTITKKEYALSDFNSVLKDHPRVSVTSFPNLKNAFQEACGRRVSIGQHLPLIAHSISQDKMTASVKIMAAEPEFKELLPELPELVIEKLKNEGVQQGLLLDQIKNSLVPMKWVEAAKGVEPVHGEDAAVRYFELSERKPVIEETGKADFYNMNFVDEVEEGDWLGEKIPPTEGANGVNVLGEELKAKRGRDRKLQYDPKSVLVKEEAGKMVLRAAAKGIVSRKGGRISVADHLVIDGDVGIGTGNIEFDGSVTVKGTVQEGFSVVAGMDLAVLSEMGVRQVERIEALNGDLFIKGGVFGKGSIKAAKSIFVKHANECSLEAGEDLHIGFYSMGSNLTAKNVITEQQRGKIIGGRITAQGKVFANEIGNRIELKTHIQVEGFDRAALKEQYTHLLNEYKQAIQKMEEVQRHVEIYENFAPNLNGAQETQLSSLRSTHSRMLKELSAFEDQRQSLLKMLEVKGDGEISIFQKAYPETYIEIKHMKKRVENETKGTFYAVGRELKYE
ncbi:DUF342 domain-containing protein [Bacillus mangrovi]|uniref:DUF342 domain-containing protein n=1 Tax=Metabacillus mangrovi TaxID=1491830 RepID=A0A7X2V6B5_9BACI|nr:FapA family protein [Metabacillus mangrovi]MTH54913.1 DUF342 domain-containing protein [Metabacillus mangrovi]